MTTSHKPSLGSLLVEARGRMTQSKAAALAAKVAPSVIGIDQTSICRWEGGERAPSLAQLEVLARVYAMSDSVKLMALRLAAVPGRESSQSCLSTSTATG